MTDFLIVDENLRTAMRFFGQATGSGEIFPLPGAVAIFSGLDYGVFNISMLDGRVTRLWANRYNQKAVDTVEVYFGFGKAELTDGAQTALVGVVKELQASPTLIVRLGGFTDPTGNRDYNYSLAQRRVESVRRFLVEKGVELSRVQAIGMGPLEDRGIPEEKKRRVTVTLMTDLD